MFSNKAMTVFAVVTAATFLACSAAVTPLYRLYQSTFDLTEPVVTLIFACYAFAALLALLTVGKLSDYVGRKPVIFFALVLNALGMLVFIFADAAWALIVARLIQGYAVGVAITALGAAILDTDKADAPTLNGVTNFAGLTIGSVGSGLLVSFAPLPTKSVYGVLLLVMVAEMVVLRFMPETAARQAGALRSLVPHVSVPLPVRGMLERLTPVNIAAWALCGFYLSLMPALVTSATGLTLPLVGASVVAVMMLAAAIGVLLLRDLRARTELIGGSAALIAGVVIALVGVYEDSVPALFAGSIVAGAGFGAAFSGTLRSLLPLAGPSDRAGLLATYFIESYLAFALPAIIAGFAAPVLGLTTTAFLYGAVVICLAIVSLVAMLIAREVAPAVD